VLGESLAKAFNTNMNTRLLGNSVFQQMSQQIDRNFAEMLEPLSQYLTIAVAKQLLRDSGYSFWVSYQSLPEISDFAEVITMDAQVQNATITNRLLSITRQNEFFNELKVYFMSSRRLKRRWKIVERALEAHQNRDYILSIPTLYTQVEGIYSDLITLRGGFIYRNGKFFVADATGNLKLNTQNKPIPLSGFRPKLEISLPTIAETEPLRNVANFLNGRFVDSRNLVLHGNDVSYYTPKRSLQLVLLILVLVIELTEFEGFQN
jgi:hypothetical protein